MNTLNLWERVRMHSIRIQELQSNISRCYKLRNTKYWTEADEAYFQRDKAELKKLKKEGA